MEIFADKYGVLSLPYQVQEPSVSSYDRLLVYLHGIGDRGKSIPELDQGWGLPQLLRGGMELPFPVISPICPAEDIWRPDLVDAFLEGLMSRPIAAGKKIILAGFSLGATGVYAYLAVHPGRVAAAVMVAGRIREFDAVSMAQAPVFAIYGDQDERYQGSDIARRMQEVRAQGGKVVLKVLEGKGHYISDEAFPMPELHAWLQDV